MKLKLKLEDVTVSSFSTDEIPNQAGTVHAFVRDDVITFRPIYTCPECNPPFREEPALA